jgi:hypothetical protein
MPATARTRTITRRITQMRRDTIWYSSKRFFDSPQDFLVCPSCRDVERMEKRREVLLNTERDDGLCDD